MCICNRLHSVTDLSNMCNNSLITSLSLTFPPLSLAEVQATRAVMILGILLSIVAVLVSTIGMKCTHFMDSKPGSKATTAMIGGIMFMISGVFRLFIKFRKASLRFNTYLRRVSYNFKL